MSLRTQKAKKASKCLAVFMPVVVLLVGTSTAAQAKGVPRYDKTRISQCHKNRDCVLDYERRARCNGMRPGVRSRECYVRYAAGFYHQDPATALRVAKCESYDDLQYWLTSPQLGMWQFAPSTWAATPFAHYNVHSPKYSSLGAMWKWAHGQKGEWVCK